MSAGFRTRFAHLIGCMENLGPTHPGKGMCFHRSAALAMDLKGSEVVLGTFRAATPEELKEMPNASTEPFIHCWVEYRGNVLAPSLIERMDMQLAPINRESYYRLNEARDIHRLSRDEMIRRAAALGLGLSAYFKRGTPLPPGNTIGDFLLEAAGVPFITTPEGTVIPR